MIRIAVLSELLKALVAESTESPGATTALLACCETAELFAYATQRDAEVQAPCTGLMAPEENSQEAVKKHLRKLVALAIAAWRDEHAVSKRTLLPPSRSLSRSRRGCSASASPDSRTRHKRFDSGSSFDLRNSGDAVRMPTSQLRLHTCEANASDSEERATSTCSDEDASPAPVLLAGVHGSLLVLPIRMSNLVAADDERQPPRGSRVALPLQDRSRRTSAATSSPSSMADYAVPRHALLSMKNNPTMTSPLVDESTELAVSADDDVDVVSQRSVVKQADGVASTMLLLVLHTDVRNPGAQEWQTLLGQANAFAEANAACARQSTPALDATYTDVPLAPAA